MRTDTTKFLTLQETTRLFHRLASYRRDKAIFLLAYRHGLRVSEVGILRIEDIDFKTLRIMIHRLKGSHSGEHPLQPDEAKPGLQNSSALTTDRYLTRLGTVEQANATGLRSGSYSAFASRPWRTPKKWRRGCEITR